MEGQADLPVVLAFTSFHNAPDLPGAHEILKGSNRTKSSVRARVEHVFGAQTNDMGGTLLRTIGLVRAKAKIGMKNLAYNMRRLVQLRRLNPCPA